MSYIQEMKERQEIEEIYEKAKKRIKDRLATKEVSMKGSAKGTALSEILSVLDDELMIGISEEMVTARKAIHEYCKRYTELDNLDRKIYDRKKEYEEMQKLSSTISLLTDETLKNAILAYNSIKDTSRDSHNAKEIAIAYINSKGREDLKDVIGIEGVNK